MKLHRTVQPNHSFFWRSELTEKRMREISAWIGSLGPQERSYLDDLLRDVRQDEQWTEMQYPLE